MEDIRDFLDLLARHAGKVVTVEVGVDADDLPDHSRPTATFYGHLGPVKMVDDDDRHGRGVAWFPVGSTEGERMGFYVESDRCRKVVVSHVGGKAWFVDGHYVAVVTR